MWFFPGSGIAAAFVLAASLALPDFLQAADSDDPRTEPASSVSPTPPAPPSDLTGQDHPWDGGDNIDLSWTLSPDDKEDAKPKRVAYYKILRSGEKSGPFEQRGIAVPESSAYKTGKIRLTIKKLSRGEPNYFRVVAVGPDGEQSEYVETGPLVATRQVFSGHRFSLAVLVVVLCGAVIYWISHARKGKPLNIRKIAGLEAVDEAVGRATEMGRSVLFIPGSQDMNDIQTIAGLTVLSRVSKTAAEYDAKVEVPTCRSLVMTAARETVQAAYLSAGRPDAYNESLIYYVTDEQFGYVAYLTGMMVREKPAACFYMGCFFAEALILAETGNSIGAIQVAGTAMPAQLPFFVAACDYTLIGEELFAASAYLSGEPEQLGSLKGQDVGKVIAGGLIGLGCLLATFDGILQGVGPLGNVVGRLLTFLKETVLV